MGGIKRRPIEKRPERGLKILPGGAGVAREAAQRTTLLEKHRQEVSHLNTWRREFGIVPNNEVDRAAALVISAVKQEFPGMWEERVSVILSELRKAEPKTVPVRICIRSESILIRQLKGLLAKAKGAAIEELENKIKWREGILAQLKEDLKAGGKSSLVLYGDHELPPWYREAKPANPEFQRFVGVRK